jgi:hypothetical protein
MAWVRSERTGWTMGDRMPQGMLRPESLLRDQRKGLGGSGDQGSWEGHFLSADLSFPHVKRAQ